MDATRFERKYMDCCGFYTGPELPGLPFSRGDRIHERDLQAAATLFIIAKREQKDREEVDRVVYI